jgi:transcriptional regulator with XRE-family HTH domain
MSAAPENDSNALSGQSKMIDELLEEASRRCAQIPSFGEVLNELRVKRGLTQRQLANCIYSSEPQVSRLINNQLPRNMEARDVHAIAASLKCTDIELALLIAAFTCHLLNSHDLIDPDIFS